MIVRDILQEFDSQKEVEEEEKKYSPFKQSPHFDDILNEIDEGIGKREINIGKPIIVIDAQNVAMRYGKNEKFTCEGITVAINFWKKHGHPVKAFAPEYLLDYEQVG